MDYIKTNLIILELCLTSINFISVLCIKKVYKESVPKIGRVQMVIKSYIFLYVVAIIILLEQLLF